MANMVQLIKQAAVEANEASKPMQVVFGNVVNKSPIQIAIDQKLTLTEEFLVLSRYVTAYDTEVTVNLNTKDGYGPEAHSHHIAEKTKVTMHNQLEVGDHVILLRIQGGQKYVVLDKVGE